MSGSRVASRQACPSLREPTPAHTQGIPRREQAPADASASAIASATVAIHRARAGPGKRTSKRPAHAATRRLRNHASPCASKRRNTQCPGVVLHGVRSLLDALEAEPLPGVVGVGLACPRPPRPPWLRCGPNWTRRHNQGDSTSPWRGQGSVDGLVAADVGADALMEELDSTDDMDYAAMLAIVRRLKRARRA